jgi:alginate O-acetyltransferase complex protein AlgI
VLFNSLGFLIFLPLVLCGYYLLNHRWQNYLLLAASLFFYACWNWRFVFLLLLTVVVDFYVARLLESMQQRGAPPARRKLVLAVSMATNLVVLGFFKYFDFFSTSMQALLNSLGLSVGTHTLNIILPVGISFYTFQSMSYTIDVYRGELPATKSFLDFTLFVCFFPHLVAGPIMRAVDMLPQVIQPRKVTHQQIHDGLYLIVWGYWKKVFVADNLAPVVNHIFSLPRASGFETLMGVYAFAVQIYCDFSGYTDIARGVAKLMGFELILNFNLPYFSRSPREFWTRWHISLSNWLRNYLYIPLGGNREGVTKTQRNLMITMVLGGLWHGAAWNFVFWGFYHGLLLVIHRALQPLLAFVKAASHAGNFLLISLEVFLMFQLTCYGWLLFRAESFAQIRDMSAALMHPLDNVDPSLAWKVAIFLVPLILIEFIQYVSGKWNLLDFTWMPMELKSAALAVVAYCILFHAAQPQAFIYFQF